MSNGKEFLARSGVGMICKVIDISKPDITCQKPNYQFLFNYCRYKMDILCFTQSVYECQTQNQKEVHHESFSSFKNLDRLSPYQFEKKILSAHTDG